MFVMMNPAPQIRSSMSSLSQNARRFPVKLGWTAAYRSATSSLTARRNKVGLPKLKTQSARTTTRISSRWRPQMVCSLMAGSNTKACESVASDWRFVTFAPIYFGFMISGEPTEGTRLGRE